MSDELTYVSVDIETSGPIPARFAMLSLGACLVSDPSTSIYIEFKPETMDFVPSALAISQLSMEKLAVEGLELADGMLQLAEWLEAVVPADHSPVFVAHNAPFDWSFVDDAFHRSLGHNPFGYAALDIKAYAMGVLRLSWSGTSFRYLAQRFLDHSELSHNALEDARDQAIVFRHLQEIAESGL